MQLSCEFNIMMIHGKGFILFFVFYEKIQVSNSIKDKSKDALRNIQGWSEKSSGWNQLWSSSHRSSRDGIRCNSRQSQIDAPFFKVGIQLLIYVPELIN